MRSRLIHATADQGEAAPVSRRAFLRRAGLGSLAGLAMTAVGDVVMSPMASAAPRPGAARPAKGQTVAFDDLADAPAGCIAYATCTPCNGCCPHGPCPPKQFCFYCSATPCGPAGVACFERADTQFYICCG